MRHILFGLVTHSLASRSEDEIRYYCDLPSNLVTSVTANEKTRITATASGAENFSFIIQGDEETFVV